MARPLYRESVVVVRHFRVDRGLLAADACIQRCRAFLVAKVHGRRRTEGAARALQYGCDKYSPR